MRISDWSSDVCSSDLVALHMGVSDDKIASGFNGFAGVKRRFTKVGEIAAGEGVVTVIDDYGHHPVEIRAVLAAAREGVGAGRVVAVVQPHPFPRLQIGRGSWRERVGQYG